MTRLTTRAALLLFALAVPCSSASAQPRPEIRALWVDAFHAGIRSASEAQLLVADAKRLNLNTLFVQVRRRGDALYASTIEPSLEDPAFDPSFDALANIVREAHAAGIQVHAWINAMPVWRDQAPPANPLHVFARHGTSAAGDDCWLTRSREGNARFPVGYFLDPGHPDARDHLVSVYLDIVRRYQVDGIHFDYIRYPETDDRLPRGANVGYNPVSLERFRKATGRTGVPAPDDEAWTRWRRQQVTELVRRISIEARAINPRIKVSAAVIAWGRPPKDRRDFENTAPMQRIFQDWRGWLSEGLLDLAVPMNYAREHDATVREWFNGWIAWERREKAKRQLAVGVGGYLSAPEGVLAQIERVREKRGARGADGVSLFSYAAPRLPAPAAGPDAGAPGAAGALPPDRLEFLLTGAAGAKGAFPVMAPVPPMPWIEHPSRGFVAGTAKVLAGNGAEGLTVKIQRRRLFGGTKRTTTDANGWFGLGDLKPGRYRVRLEDARGNAMGEPADVQVTAGQVSRANIE